MWRYKLLLFIFFIPLVFYTLWQSIRQGEPRYFLQRLAVFFPARLPKNSLWFHAASVGEVNAVMPLIQYLQQQHPGITITLSTNTATGAQTAMKQFSGKIYHVYFPLDYAYAITRFLNALSPAACFIVETEIWPNLYNECFQHNIPLLIINGRISDKTLYAPSWIKPVYKQTLQKVTHVYARSETDADRFIQLGLAKDKITLLGNLKFVLPETSDLNPLELNRTFILAASTREDEEKLVVQAWLSSEHADHLLVIVPRHPNRINDILQDLKFFNVNIAVRSKNDPVTEETKIYIADTIGELKSFIHEAEFVIMGGSFVAKGGHNILEIAQAGKAVIFGEDMRNFSDEATLFLQHHAGIQCLDTKQLATSITQLIKEPAQASKLGENGFLLLSSAENILEEYNKQIKTYLA